MSAHEIQAFLDEHKEELSDDLYLKLSNLNMKKNNNTKAFYRALYLIPTIFDINDNECEYRLELKSESRIIEMNNEAYEEMNDRIEKTLFNSSHLCQLAQGDNEFTKRMINKYYDFDEKQMKYSSTTIHFKQREYLIKLEKIE